MSKMKLAAGLTLAWLYRKLTKGEQSIFLRCDERTAREVDKRLKKEYPKKKFRVYYSAGDAGNGVETWQRVN